MEIIMPKPGIHPTMKTVTLRFPDKTEFKTESVYANDVFHIEMDYREHSAWKGGVSRANVNDTRIAEFNKKFSGFFGASNKAVETMDADAAAATDAAENTDKAE
jgi:ribosomal protein L31